jgi:hypothetical protein
MPLIIAKLLSADSKADLDTKIAAYKAGAGAELLTSQRAMASHEFIEADGEFRTNAILFHGGADVPALKTADLQHVIVRTKGKIDELQVAITAALAQVENLRVTDANTTVAGHVTSATAPFAAEDVGRLIEIAGVQKTITVFNAANDVSYNNTAGNFASGSGLTMKLLGAEVIQDAHMTMCKSRSGTHQLHLLMACEGQLP